MTGVGEAGSREARGERREALTAPVEDYLKAIYAIGKGSGPAATNEIAQRLDLAPASVSGMVRRLADQGLLAYERYHGVKLTDSGRRAALRTLRRALATGSRPEFAPGVVLHPGASGARTEVYPALIRPSGA